MLIRLICAALWYSVFCFGTEVCHVYAVSDGDTIRAMCKDEPITVRIANIDAPETKQPFGKQAKAYAVKLALGKKVHVTGQNRDRYGRTVATITLPNGADLGREMVRSGYAWEFVRYSKDAKLQSLEAAARRARLGLWAEDAPIYPAAFRQARRSKLP
jgi:micrococcal nuclease